MKPKKRPASIGVVHEFRCIECGAPASEVYKEYSPGNIRLSVCDGCHGLVDKYIEYEFTLIALDLVLMKSRAYRHLLYNRSPILRGLDVWKAVVLSVLLDAYLKWVLRYAHELEGGASVELHQKLDTYLSPDISSVGLGIKIVTAVFVELVTYFIAIVAIMKVNLAGSRILDVAAYKRFMVVVLSTGYSKLLLAVLMMVWHFDYSFIRIISALVLISNVEAVKAFLYTTTGRASLCVGVALAVRLAARLLLHTFDPSMALAPEHPSMSSIAQWAIQ
jgi:hypothetical protein